MTEERDPKVSAAYRELGAEEPPRALDDAILAAARREAGSHPAPLVAPAGRRRWFAPLAATAVLVLAVSVTLHMKQEQPEVDSLSRRAEPSPPPVKITGAPQSVPAAPAPAAELQSQPRPQPQPKIVASKGEEEGKAKRQMIAEAPRTAEPKPFLEDKVPAASPAVAGSLAGAPAPASAPTAAPEAVLSSRADQARAEGSSATGASARRAEERTSRDEIAAARAPQSGELQPLAKRAVTHANVQAETPERELERIAELRRQGKHDDADKALAEFRKRYPGYRIPEAMRARVERR